MRPIGERRIFVGWPKWSAPHPPSNSSSRSTCGLSRNSTNASRSTHNEKHQKANREPWLLGTSLSEGFKIAEKAVKLYALRIEEAFRDLKSTRFGLSLELHHTYQLEGMQVLLLIATLALMVAWLMGHATELTGRHRHYQANTVRDRVVLSTIFLGLKVIDDPRVVLRLADVIAAINSLQEILQRHCYDGSNSA